MNEGEVIFCIYCSDIDPDVVTQRIGLSPSRTRRKADPIPRQSSWQLSSGRVLSELVDVYELSSNLVACLEPHADAIRSLLQELDFSAELQVVLHISIDEAVSTPAIGFDKPVVEFLARVGASIDVDTYRREG